MGGLCRCSVSDLAAVLGFVNELCGDRGLQMLTAGVYLAFQVALSHLLQTDEENL